MKEKHQTMRKPTPKEITVIMEKKVLNKYCTSFESFKMIYSLSKAKWDRLLPKVTN